MHNDQGAQDWSPVNAIRKSCAEHASDKTDFASFLAIFIRVGHCSVPIDHFPMSL
jgi:hypothetical protein